MNDTDFITIEQDESAAAAAPAPSFLTRYRSLSITLAVTLASAAAITTGYGLLAKHDEVKTPAPVQVKPEEFKVVHRADMSPASGSKPKGRPVSLSKPGTPAEAALPVKAPAFLLTFDDGPHPKYTPQILDWLMQNHLHATFFLVGENVVRYPALVKRILAEGHEIGNHSWDHPKLTGMTDAKVRSQIKRTHDAIVKACGKAPTLFRPPYGALKPAQKTWIEKEFGYKTELWDIDTLDWTKGTTSAAVAKRIQQGLKPGSTNIILSHDIHPLILPALQQLSGKVLPRSPSVAKVDDESVF